MISAIRTNQNMSKVSKRIYIPSCIHIAPLEKVLLSDSVSNTVWFWHALTPSESSHK